MRGNGSCGRNHISWINQAIPTIAGASSRITIQQEQCGREIAVVSRYAELQIEKGAFSGLFARRSCFVYGEMPQ
jgi:hypothetical protein